MINNKNRPLQAILLDDEIDASRNLQVFLQRYWNDRVEVVGMVQSTHAAEQMMEQIKPDVLFIDIEMPEENAFQFLDRISPFSFEIIFVTAYDEYALRALKLNAVDYILKPISIDELNTAIAKLEDRISFRHFSKKYFPENQFNDINEQILKKQLEERIVLKSKTEVHVLFFKDILYIEAEGSYAHFYFEDQGIMNNMLMSRPLVDYEDLLPNDLFYRIHKSYLVNCKHIRKITKEENYFVVMSNGERLTLSRRRHIGLINFLKKHNFN